jgi:hypothetical protein
MAYSREEQETTLVFEVITGEWRVYSSVPKHIRKLNELTELNVLEFESDGTTPKAVTGTLSEKQVSMKKLRILTDEQREQLAERMRNIKPKS